MRPFSMLLIVEGWIPAARARAAFVSPRASRLSVICLHVNVACILPVLSTRYCIDIYVCQDLLLNTKYLNSTVKTTVLMEGTRQCHSRPTCSGGLFTGNESSKGIRLQLIFPRRSRTQRAFITLRMLNDRLLLESLPPDLSAYRDAHMNAQKRIVEKRTDENGVVFVKFADGTIRQERPDGSYFIFEDGHWWEPF